MLSAESQTIYDILFDITGGSDKHKIIDVEEITAKLPEGISFTKVQLSQIIRDLKDMDYVEVKYFTPDEYCLRVLKRIIEQPKAPDGIPLEQVNEGAVEETGKKQRQLYDKKKGAAAVRPGLVLFMSFLGGIIGSGLVAAVTAILLKFVF